jgi:hypothetical protein
MHWKAFNRLVVKHNAYVDQSLREMTKKFGDLGVVDIC